MWSDLTLGPSFKVKQRCPNLKVPISRLLLVLLLVKQGWQSLKVPISSLLLHPEVWDVKLTLNSTFLHPGRRSYHCSGLVNLNFHIMHCLQGGFVLSQAQFVYDLSVLYHVTQKCNGLYAKAG